jgi:hypothetical protein
MKRAVLLCLATILAGSIAIAQGPGFGPAEGPGHPGGPPPGGLRFLPLFRVLDSDGDGTLSTAEIAKASVSLKKLDKNKDGKLTEDELRPKGPPPGRGGPDGPPPGGPR